MVNANILIGSCKKLFITFVATLCAFILVSRSLADGPISCPSKRQFRRQLVNFRSLFIGCDTPVACGVEVAGTVLQQGQGRHGTFSRTDTLINMAAIGPDFKKGFTDLAPVSNVYVHITQLLLLSRSLTEWCF